MQLDLPTLMWEMTIICFTLSLSVLFVGRRTQDRDGLSTWGWGLLVYGLSYPAFGLRLLGWTGPSILLADTLISATLALQCVAVARFQKAQLPAPAPALVWGPVLLTVLSALLLLSRHQERSVVFTLILTSQAMLLAWQAWSPRLQGVREHGRYLLTAGTGFLVLILLLRILFLAIAGDWSSELAVPRDVQALTYLVTSTVVLLNTMGFILMQKEQAVEQQHEQAVHDALTGLANRRALHEELGRHLSRASRSAQPIALLMLDIDFFKKVNDTHGHQAGDAVLRELSLRIQGRLRHHDLLARYGGEEFLVVLPDTPLDGALAVAEDVRRAVEETPFLVEGRSIAITISVGVHAGVPPGWEQIADGMIAASDEALYRAKQNGRNRVETSTPPAALA